MINFEDLSRALY